MTTTQPLTIRCHTCRRQDKTTPVLGFIDKTTKAVELKDNLARHPSDALKFRCTKGHRLDAGDPAALTLIDKATELQQDIFPIQLAPP